MRGPVRVILFLPALLIAYLLLPTNAAHAAEKRMMGDVTVGEGETAEEVSTTWGDVTVEGNVKDNVESGFGDIWVEGPVGGDVDAGSGDVHINAPVGGDVDVGRGDVYLESGAQVKGDVSHHSGSLYRQSDAVVDGPQMAGVAPSFDSRVGASAGVIGWTVMTLGLIAATVLLAVAAPRPLRASARSLEVAPGRSLILGLGSVPVAIVASILLAVTVVGIPLLALAVPVYLALLLFGVLVAAYFLGSRIMLATGRYRAGDALAAAVGAFLVSAAYLIPFLGGLVFAFLALLGAGAAVSALLARRRSSGTPHAAYASYEDYLEDRR
jgi:hypothetical protein